MADAVELQGSFGPSAASRADGASTGPIRLGPGFRARSILDSQRYRELSFKESHYRCTQHAGKSYDFEGRAVAPGAPTSMPFLSSEKSPVYIPLTLRRPSCPVRMGKLIVTRFTALLLGEQRWPKTACAADPASAEYANALDKASGLQAKFIQARALGGSTGTVGFSWCFYDGLPRVQVHSAKHLFVHEWESRDELVPKAVSEVYRYPVEEWDQQRGEFVRNVYWHHRYWDDEKDVRFLPVRFDPKVEPRWVPDKEATVVHGDGRCHFVWCQNLPSEEIDGEADYDGLYEGFDTIDIINSVLAKGGILNLDPTLVLKVEEMKVRFGAVKKGSDNALAVGPEGDAKYLELAGTSIEAGLKYLEAIKKDALDVAQCVLADANEVAAAGISSVALKVIYAPMIAKCDVLREQYGQARTRLLSQMTQVSRRHFPAGVVRLPPSIDPRGELVALTPGKSDDLESVWGSYFLPTPDDRQKLLASLQAAVGNRAVVALRTGVEEAATALGKDPEQELSRYDQEVQDRLSRDAQAFQDADQGGRQVQVVKTGQDETLTIAGAAGAPGKPGAGAPGGGGDAGGGFSEAGP